MKRTALKRGKPLARGSSSLKRSAFPLCRRHHDDAEAKRGPFAGWTKQQTREWHRAESARVVALYERCRP